MVFTIIKKPYLDRAEMSLIILFELGIDVCIISNHENPNHKWNDPRTTYAIVLSEIYLKLIRRIILFYHNHHSY